VVDNDGDFLVRIELLEIGRMVRGSPDIDGLEIVLEPALLEHDENFLHVRAGQSIEVDHGVPQHV
jgi:hypothetical protein